MTYTSRYRSIFAKLFPLLFGGLVLLATSCKSGKNEPAAVKTATSTELLVEGQKDRFGRSLYDDFQTLEQGVALSRLLPRKGERWVTLNPDELNVVGRAIDTYASDRTKVDCISYPLAIAGSVKDHHQQVLLFDRMLPLLNYDQFEPEIVPTLESFVETGNDTYVRELSKGSNKKLAQFAQRALKSSKT